MMKSTASLRLLLALAGVAFLATACSKSDHAAHDHDKKSAHSAHDHTAPHGGTLVEIGEHAYKYRQTRTLWGFHYSFHAYINMLSHKFKDQFTSRELREILGASLKLERDFHGVGIWYT